ncbi:DUF3575 domain-containing protein [Porphyromonadaceae bacterium W3.11]|nr:DUF3575 domain-containing protein [Porphyromonadaceae bacterium W3.11]
MNVRRSLTNLLMISIVSMMLSVGCAYAQKVALKTNLLYGATTSPNLALEMRLNDKMTLELGGGASFWEFKTNSRFKHWMAQPELRWWTCDVFNGHFFGLHLHGGQYNVGGINIPVGRLSNLKDHRFQGYFYGAGLSYGYQWVLSRHWNIEGSLGAGYARFFYEKFPCTNCGTKMDEGHYNYWGVTRATLSLVYVF